MFFHTSGDVQIFVIYT